MFEVGSAARPGMDRDAGRLVDDQHQPIAIKDPLGQLIRPDWSRTPGFRVATRSRLCRRRSPGRAREGCGAGLCLRHHRKHRLAARSAQAVAGWLVAGDARH